MSQARSQSQRYASLDCHRGAAAATPGRRSAEQSAPASIGRRAVLSLLTAPAVLVAPPFLADPPFLATPPVVDTTAPLMVPSFAGPRSPEWLADIRVEWANFERRYVASDGRVIDTGNNNISHTEGQGVALLVAVEAGDLANFRRILDWTRRTLGRRGDRLHAWRYRPNAVTPVSDINNATDGDILIAWALQRAAVRFGQSEYADLAADIAQDIKELCLRRIGQRLVLLPGAFGFERRDHVILNPSYYIFPALLDFEKLVPGPYWRELVMTGLEICCRSALFGRWRLPADWIEVPRDPGLPVNLALDWPGRFSWDAVRVPLNLAWGRRWGEPSLHASVAFWDDPAHAQRLPAWVDLRSDGPAPYPGHAGVQAVAQLARAACQRTQRTPALPRVSDATDYYSAALTLLARLAWHDGQAIS